jgi:hypothetical protein
MARSTAIVGGGSNMKVTDVACHILQCKVDKPFARLGLWHALVLRGRDLDRRGHHRMG